MGDSLDRKSGCPCLTSHPPGWGDNAESGFPGQLSKKCLTIHAEAHGHSTLGTRAAISGKVVAAERVMASGSDQTLIMKSRHYPSMRSTAEQFLDPDKVVDVVKMNYPRVSKRPLDLTSRH
jgi:hypothetical protein